MKLVSISSKGNFSAALTLECRLENTVIRRTLKSEPRKKKCGEFYLLIQVLKLQQLQYFWMSVQHTEPELLLEMLQIKLNKKLLICQ